MWIGLVAFVLVGFAVWQLARTGADPESLSRAYGFDIGNYPAISEERSERAPVLQGPKLGGGNLSLADYRGKVVVVNLWASCFAAAAWAQLAWTLLVTRSEDRRLLFAGVGGNLAIALVWVASRTIGLPLGPNPGVREAVQFIDILATAVEILAAVSIALALRLGARLVSARRAAALIAALALVVIPTTTAAIATGTDHAHSDLTTGRTHAKQAHR